jgi:DNA-binding NarL/FixJ family response regulator
VIFALCAACLISILTASVSFKLYRKLRAELRQVAFKAVNAQQVSEMSSGLSARLSLCESRLASADRIRKDHAEWVSQAQSLNLNRRGQVLRLHRRGESAAEIASSLRMGQGEVKLIIKVYEISRATPGWEQNQL